MRLLTNKSLMLRTFVIALGLTCALAFAQRVNPWQGVDNLDTQNAQNYILGYNDTFILDASSATAIAPLTFRNCRAISVDVSGIIRIRYFNKAGKFSEVKQVTAGLIYPIRNVERLYRFYTGSTPGTAESFSALGVTIVNAIKLHR